MSGFDTAKVSVAAEVRLEPTRALFLRVLDGSILFDACKIRAQIDEEQAQYLERIKNKTALACVDAWPLS